MSKVLEILNRIQEREVERKDHFSFSRLRMFQMCPRSYFYRYIQGVETAPNSNLIFGSAIGASLEECYKEMIEGGRPAVSTAEDVFMEAFRGRAVDVDWAKDDANAEDLQNMGTALIAHHVREYMPTQRPVAVEAKVELELGVAPGRPIIGYLDLLEEDGVITDHKTAKRKYNQSQGAERSLQLLFYAAATGREMVKYDVLLKGKQPALQLWDTSPFLRAAATPERKVWAVNCFKSIIRNILLLEKESKEAWPVADPTSWKCSPKFCEYWDMCQKELRGEQ